MPSYYVKNAPKCKTENGKFVIEGDDDTDDEWIMEWSTVLPLLRNMQRLAAEFDAHNRKAVVPACRSCRDSHPLQSHRWQEPDRKCDVLDAG